MNGSTKRALLVAAVIGALGALLIGALRAQPESEDAHVLRLGRHIGCPICAGESVTESNNEISRDIRAEIRDRVRSHESDQSILGYYAKVFPRQQLTPSDGGVGLIAWGLPLVAIVAAAAGLVFAFVRWRRVPRLTATDADEALVLRARKDM